MGVKSIVSTFAPLGFHSNQPRKKVAVSVLRKLQTIAVDDPEFPRGASTQKVWWKRITLAAFSENYMKFKK